MKVRSFSVQASEPEKMTKKQNGPDILGHPVLHLKSKLRYCLSMYYVGAGWLLRGPGHDAGCHHRLRETISPNPNRVVPDF